MLGFGCALGATGFAYPLLAIDSGLSVSTVGLLAAASAGTQMTSRLVLPKLLATFKDRTLMIWALSVMAASAGILLVSLALAAFVVAQICQGFARGVFHTSSQTHAVRDFGVASRRLAFVQTTAQLGRLIGPAVGGLLAIISLKACLVFVVGLTVAGAAFGVTLQPRPPYRRAPAAERTPIWRRGELGVACWGGGVGGVWRGLAESFVPVILLDRGLSAATIGWMLSAADGAGFATTASVAKWGSEDTRRFVPACAVVVAGSLALLPVLSDVVPLGVAMVAAGSAGGVAGVLGTAAANAAVEPEEQGAAITLVGTYRAATRLVAPASVSGLLGLVSLGPAMAIFAVGIVAPIPWLVPRAWSALGQSR